MEASSRYRSGRAEVAAGALPPSLPASGVSVAAVADPSKGQAGWKGVTAAPSGGAAGSTEKGSTEKGSTEKGSTEKGSSAEKHNAGRHGADGAAAAGVTRAGDSARTPPLDIGQRMNHAGFNHAGGGGTRRTGTTAPAWAMRRRTRTPW